MAKPVLTPEEVRTYLQDRPDVNYLLDGLEFSDPQVILAMELAVDDYNSIPPDSMRATLETFPSKTVLLFGTCYQLMLGQAQHLARNTMQYSDGGTQIPIEERSPLYSQMAGSFQSLFMDKAQRLKVSRNIESGFGEVSSDFGWMPVW